MPINIALRDRAAYGTGSYPPFEKGLQRKIRQKARALPFTAPCFSTAIKPYCEHVGQ